jgi:hypothetical protein
MIEPPLPPSRRKQDREDEKEGSKGREVHKRKR